MTLTISDNASGAWSGEVDTPVTVLETAPNGRAVRVLLPEEHPRYRKLGSWLPATWIDGIVAPPLPVAPVLERCPTCGQTIKSECIEVTG